MKMEKLDLNTIKRGSFIRKYTTTYLVRDFHVKYDNDRNPKEYILDYFFCLSRKPNPHLHKDSSINISIYHIDSLKEAQDDMIKTLIDSIKNEYPQFDISKFSPGLKNDKIDEKLDNGIKALETACFVLDKKFGQNFHKTNPELVLKLTEILNK